MANYSPPSSGNHRSLFVKPAKRGKQRTGGEALFALHYFIFNYQLCHPHNCFISQRHRCCAIIQMNEFCNINALMVQRCKRCSFDSPGLASESEGYPGLFTISEHNAVGVVPFIPRHFIMAFHIENVQHLRR